MSSRKNVGFAYMAIAAAILMAVFSGCATETTVTGIKPAEVSLGGIRTLAILNFDGPYGETVRSDFYSLLGEVQHFNLVDTTAINALDSVAFEQIDDPRFLPALENLHADGVIMGRVTASTNDVRGTDQVQMQEGTGQYKKQKNIFGQWVDVEIKRTVLRPVAYVIRQGSLTADFKVFDLRSRRIIATDKVTETFNKKYGGNKEHAMFGASKMSHLPSQDSTIQSLSRKAACKLVSKIAPTKVSTKVKFDIGNSLVSKGIDFAKRGLWEDAIAVWKESTEMYPDHAPAFYNLGVAYESWGDAASLRMAQDMYRKASRISNKSLYMDALARISKSIRDREKYERQRRQLESVPETKSGATQGPRVY